MVCKWLAITAQKFGELSLFTVYFCFSRKKLEPYRTTAVRPFLAMNTGIIAIPWAIRIGMVSGTMATAGELCIIVKTPRRADNLAEVVPATTKNVQPLVLARACKYLVSSLILLFLVFLSLLSLIPALFCLKFFYCLFNGFLSTLCKKLRSDWKEQHKQEGEMFYLFARFRQNVFFRCFRITTFVFEEN